MRIAKGNSSLLAIMIICGSLLSLGSCKKASNSTSTAIPLIGGFLSSDSVEPNALIAYWPFDGSAQEKVGGILGEAYFEKWSYGIRAEAFQGFIDSTSTDSDDWTENGYDGRLGPTYPGYAAFDSLHSFSVSLWFNVPHQVTSAQQGLLFLYSGLHTNLLELEFEPDSTFAGDILKVHAGFTNPKGIAFKEIIQEGILHSATARWVHLVMTYNAGSSQFALYRDAVPVALLSAWSHSAYVTSPIPIWTDGNANVPMGNIDFSSDYLQGVSIGNIPNSGFYSGAFLGKLDEVRIFNIAITQKDVTGLYLNGLAAR